MSVPSAVFGLLCALLAGASFHLIVDGGPGRLVLYLTLGIFGFGLGQWLAVTQGWRLLPLGGLQLGPALIGSIAALLLGHWLGRVEPQGPPGDRGV